MTAFVQMVASLYQDPKGIPRSCPDGACQLSPGCVQTLWDSILLESTLPMWRLILSSCLALPQGVTSVLQLPEISGMYF